MLRLGVIEESQSDCNSPVVLVEKPDESTQFCIDFRRINEKSKFDTYPMPRVDELLERLGMAHFVTTLDLMKGYWQIPLTPESRERTAFSTLGYTNLGPCPLGCTEHQPLSTYAFRVVHRAGNLHQNADFFSWEGMGV
ncbi:UNVERIFIED_CONTAM: hypothetical protein FKN15_017686 [Acipenser sinensis]